MPIICQEEIAKYFIRARHETVLQSGKIRFCYPISQQKPGVAEVKVWINAGNLKVGDTIMLLLVAGKFRTNVLPVREELLSIVKSEILTEGKVQ
jgi:molybdopterin synthase catalytic subunit